MGAGSALKDAYYSLEDKWYGFVDSVGEKIPAFSNFVDGLEDKGIPTFPAFIVLVIIIIALLAYFFIFASSSSLTINVTDASGNPIESAIVVVLAGTDQKASIETNASGIAVFFLPNGEYSIKIDKDTYSTTTQSVVLQGDASQDMVLTLADSTLTKSVFLRDASGALVGGSGTLIYKCIDGNEEQTATYVNGKFDATVKASCAGVEVLSIQNYNLVTTRASFASNSAVTVSQQVVLKGSVSVTLSISGSQDTPPAGLRVRLIPNDGTVPIEEISTGTSVVLFDFVPIKSYYVAIIDPNGQFESYDGSKTNDTKAVSENQLTQFTAVLTKAQSSVISITVKDAATNAPIKGADITITSLTSTSDTQTKTTDVTGEKDFSVTAGSAYTISVEQNDYITGITKQAIAGDSVDILLTKADGTNSDSILVQVVDPKGDAIENARVQLKTTENGTPTIGEKTTGADGTATFYNLDITKTYYATVSKQGFGSQDSTSIQAQPRAQRTLQVSFDIGEGKIDLQVLDSSKNPLSGASVKAINYYTSQQEGSTILSDSSGNAEFNLRADKLVYFVVETTGYSKYFTATIQPSANATVQKQVILQTPTSKLTATLVGVYSGTNEVVNSTSAQSPVTQGVYTVKAVVQVPKGSYSEAGLQLRTGAQTQNVTNNMEEDGLYLNSVVSSGRITKGTTYTPPQGNSADLKNTTAGDAKWANSVWKNPTEATFEVEAEVTITETNPNVPLNLYYRGWAKGSTTLRDPAGDVQSQELYWPAKNRILTSGSSNLCSASFCKSYTLQTLSGNDTGKKQIVLGTVPATKGINYSLEADLTNYSGKEMSGAVLSVTGKSLDINSVMINGVVQSATSAISLGTIGIDAPINVIVVFNTVASGAASVKFTINDSKATELDEAVNLSVRVNKTFTFSMLPKVVVPYIDNTLFFEALDSNVALDGVNVSITSGNDLLTNVQTNGEGLANYVLSQPRIGDVLTITAQKEGYDPVEITQKVDSALLTIIPNTIAQTIKVGVIKSIDTEVVLQNDTPKDIKVVSAQINGDVKQYVDIKFNDTINGTVIAQGADRNYSLTLKLNSNAQRIAEPKDLTGTILINTEIAGSKNDYISEIPIAIRLSMPGYLDTAKCLKSDTTSIDFVVSDSPQSKTITLTNACEAESNPLTLHNIQAKLSDELKIGTITVSGAEFKNTQLNTKYNDIADTIDPASDNQLTINFTPNPAVSSGTQTFSISFAAQNILDDTTTEKVESAINVNSTTSYLSKCVVISQPSGGVLLDVAPWNTGYSRILSSSYSSSLNSYGGFTNQSAPYNMGYMQNMGMGGYGTAGYGAGYSNTFNPYGNASQYGSPYGQTSSNLGADTTYQQSSFIIKNTCATDVDVQLEPDSRISIGTDKFTISADSDYTVTVQPGYVFGKYAIKVSAKPSASLETKKSVGNVSVIVRRLGDIDTDCIKSNITSINLDSFTYTPQTYSVYNYCYDQGAQLSRSNVASIECSAPKNQYDLGYLQTNQSQYYGSQFPLTTQNPTYNSYVSQNMIQPSGGIQANGCAISNCSLITGTRVKYRAVEVGANGSVERVDFYVMPNAQYIPQMKLFDSSRNSYGAFQNLSAIRQWSSQTEARTDVYGNLDISYTNQYGSAQCMEFPITISDTWRMLESIDSAINWGDPNAKPSECQGSTEKNALNLTQYWKDHDSASNGAIPNNKYVNGKYTYLAAPPALNIGPSPTQQSSAYPTNIYQYQLMQASTYNQANNTQTKSTAPKNCGLLDSIDVKTTIDPKTVGGAIIKVSDIGSGSVLNNSRGSNLGVEIDNTQMTMNCFEIKNMPIVAKVTRTITLQSEDLTWQLNAIITKPGFTMTDPAQCGKLEGQITTTCTDYLKQALTSSPKAKSDVAGIQAIIDKVGADHKECAGQIGLNDALSLIDQTNTTAGILKGCTASPNDYGYNLIDLSHVDFKSTQALKEYDKDHMTDCAERFCNNNMLQTFLLNRFAQIKELMSSTPTHPVASEDTFISKLYKQVKTDSIPMCAQGDLNFYEKDDGTLGYAPFEITKDMRTISGTDQNNTINNFNNTANGGNALSSMLSVINNIKAKDAKDYNSILLEIDANQALKDHLDLMGLKAVNNKYYMSIETYRTLLQVATNPKTASLFNNPAVTILSKTDGYCFVISTFYADAMQWMAYNSRLVKGIYDKKSMDNNEIEQIYLANANYNKIHDLAKFSTSAKNINSSLEGDLLTTKIPQMADLTKLGFTNLPSNINDLTLNFTDKKGNPFAATDVGSYPMELDYNYLISEPKNATVVVGDNNLLALPKKATVNPMLTSGFNVMPVQAEHILDNEQFGKILTPNINGGIDFYQRVPVKLSVQLNSNENAFNYKVYNSVSILPQSLIEWYTLNGVKKGNDTRTAVGYTISVAPTTITQMLIGVYYYAAGNQLIILPSTTGGTVTATLQTKENAGQVLVSNQQIPRPTVSGQELSISSNTDPSSQLTLDKIVTELTDPAGNACPEDNGVYWNEQKIVGAN